MGRQVKEVREKKGREGRGEKEYRKGKEGRGREGKRTSEHSSSFQSATTPLQTTDGRMT